MIVAMVSKLFPLSHYTIYLGQGFEALSRKVIIVFYRSKEENATVPLHRVRNVWSQSLTYPFEVFRQSIKDRPDIVHIQHEFNMFGDSLTAVVFPILLVLLKIARRKTVVTIHQVVPMQQIDRAFAKSFSFPQLFWPLLKIALLTVYLSITALASMIIVHSDYNRRFMISDYKAQPSHVSVVPIGVPALEEEPASNKWTNVLQGRKVILFFGYLNERKGIEYLFEAFAQIVPQHPEWVLVIAGGILPYSSPYIARLVKMISDLKIEDHVVFLTTTPFPIPEIHELYSLSEFVVLPYTYSFAASLALSFAMEHSKPTIVTNIGVFREDVQHGHEGLHCPPRESQRLKEAMISLINDEGMRRKFSENVRLKAKSRAWSSIADQTYQAYLESLECE